MWMWRTDAGEVPSGVRHLEFSSGSERLLAITYAFYMYKYINSRLDVLSEKRKPAGNRPGVSGCSAGVLLILRWCVFPKVLLSERLDASSELLGMVLAESRSALEFSGRRSLSRYARRFPAYVYIILLYLHKMIPNCFLLSQPHCLLRRIGNHSRSHDLTGGFPSHCLQQQSQQKHHQSKTVAWPPHFVCHVRKETSEVFSI